MSTAKEIRVWVDDLAGHWTDAGLELLEAAGIHHVSVEMELETWQTLKKLLRFELFRRRAFRRSTLASLTAFMEDVLGRSVVLTAQKFEPQFVTSEFKTRIRRSAAGRRSTLAERRLYAKILRPSALRHDFKRPNRMDFVRRRQESSPSG